MENETIERIFLNNGMLMESIKPTDKFLKKSGEADDIFKKLVEHLTNEQQNILNDYIDKLMEAEVETVDSYFIAALKLGFRLAVECLTD